jgi:hypothetical protein
VQRLFMRFLPVDHRLGQPSAVSPASLDPSSAWCDEPIGCIHRWRLGGATTGPPRDAQPGVKVETDPAERETARVRTYASMPRHSDVLRCSIA